ncbi:MAG: 23S rRNA (pseudouridine(1915)-N(3))-methyltransferase RlmH [Bacteroidia bacterium]|nr:23S rRNA (pseudouridine(1915)-N(3))-methyltransferase RlmH [Bacteroidia bacterium]
MRIVLLQIDKTQDSYLTEGIEIYNRRLKNYTSFDTITIHVPKQVRQRTMAEQKTEEAKLILAQLAAEDHLVLLDERGKEFSSLEFSKFISQKQNASTKRLIFLIGGPFGFDQKVYDRANSKLSLSKLTFSHQMVRLFFVEQLYRAFTILKGEKYHHE